ncbi:TVP38/TMEM64 family protein [Staphylococcus chromogenes]|nr:TVP38/TMEM64 family protein [Staphylococcus chromogenes]
MSPKVRKLLLACFIVAGVAVLAFFDVPSPEKLHRIFEQFGLWAWLAYFFTYVVLTQFPIPRTVFTITSGIMFGPLWGTVLAISATTVSAALSLTLMRSLVDDPTQVAQPRDSWLQRLAARHKQHPALAKVNARLEHRGGIAVFFLRLIAGIPFSVLNYACAFTPIRLRPYVVATFFGSAPSTIAGVLLGDALNYSHDTRMLWVLAGLFTIGIIGLIADFLYPVKSKG